jgi:hypothetical protein
MVMIMLTMVMIMLTMVMIMLGQLWIANLGTEEAIALSLSVQWLPLTRNGGPMVA